jgi:hypothetical protein
MNEKTYAKISWDLTLVFAFSIVWGLCAHIFGFHINPMLGGFDLASLVISGVLFLLTFILWLVSGFKHPLLIKRKPFLVFSLLIPLFTLTFLIDAIFTVTLETTEETVITLTTWWPFLLIELPLFFVLIAFADRFLIWPINRAYINCVYQRKGHLRSYQMFLVNRIYYENTLLLLKTYFSKKDPNATAIQIKAAAKEAKLEFSFPEESSLKTIDSQQLSEEVQEDCSDAIASNQNILVDVDLGKVAKRLSRKALKMQAKS